MGSLPTGNSPGDLTDPLASMSDTDWRTLRQRVRLHTWRRYRWLYDATGYDLDDIVQRALLDALSGKRRWPVREEDGSLKNIDLFTFLCGTVRSIVSHTWERERKSLSLDNLDKLRPDDDRELMARIREPIHGGRQFAGLEHIDEQADYRRLTDKILVLISEDSELGQIVKALQNDPDLKPNEIAAELGLTMPRMRAAQKRLRRLLRHSKS